MSILPRLYITIIFPSILGMLIPRLIVNEEYIATVLAAIALLLNFRIIWEDRYDRR